MTWDCTYIKSASGNGLVPTAKTGQKEKKDKQEIHIEW